MNFRCLDCKRKSKLEDVRTNVAAGTVVYCRSSSCGGILKPDITFFGEELPDQFFKAIKQDVSKCDLVIVIGMKFNKFGMVFTDQEVLIFIMLMAVLRIHSNLFHCLSKPTKFLVLSWAGLF